MLLMQDLKNKIEALKKSKIKIQIDKRIQEFKNINKKSIDDLFIELCFCILTANFNAEKSIKIQEKIGSCFLTDNKDELSKKLREFGHRFPNTRAEYISESLKCKDKLTEVLQSNDKKAIRDWVVNNVKGLSYKESSHFLRNIGFDDYAIIDFHIIDILSNHNLIKKPQTITKKKYLEIENILKKLAKETNLTLAELDLYLWYMETGKILK
jgi:N-glycosylase/DNA lyase